MKIKNGVYDTVIQPNLCHCLVINSVSTGVDHALFGQRYLGRVIN